jgi:glycogen synthase
LKINVLLYCRDWLPVVGGAQTVSLTLATGLAEWSKSHPSESFEVILATKTSANATYDSQFPFRVVRLPGTRELIRHIRSADVLHVAGPAFFPLLIAQVFRVPTVVEHHGYQSVCPNGLLLYAPDHTICPGHFMAGRYRKCLECNAKDLGWIGSFRKLVLTFPRRWLCKRVAANIAVSNHVAMRIALPHTHTIYHGIQDASGFVSDPAPSQGNQLTIGYVGRLVGEKGLPLLLDAANQLEKEGMPFQLTFIGDGPQRSELESLACRLNLQDRVSFTGDLRGAAFAKALQSVQVVAMPSQCEETAGLAAMEQMMRGGVVVAADTGGLSEVVGEAGLKFPVNDLAALTACLRKVYGNPSLLNSLGSAARSRAIRYFDLEIMIQKHVEVYKAASRSSLSARNG